METNKDIFEEKPKSSLAKVLEILSTMASKPSGFIGLAILIFHVVLAVTSPWVAPYDYKSINSSLMLQAPSLEYWFGTDSLGRDVFTRTILGGRTALTVTFFGSIIALLWGGLLGIFCGLVGGRIDDIVMRIVDAFLSIPWISSHVVDCFSSRDIDRSINTSPRFFLWKRNSSSCESSHT